MPLTPLQQPRPLSVRIGRIAVRLLLVGMAAWAVLTGYRAYVRHQLAQEIAPVHAFANGISLMLRSGDYFALQEQLSPTRQHRVSIDWLAHFAENTEWNATTGLAWGDWNKTEGPTSQYRLTAVLTYRTGRHHPVEWLIEKRDSNLTLQQLRLGNRTLLPTNVPSFP